MTNREWGEAGDLVCHILGTVYEEQRESFVQQARDRGITLEQFAAAAILGALQERMKEVRWIRKPGGPG